jgi:hypothetical protein
LDSEKQIIKELKNINQSLDSIQERLDESEGKSASIFDPIKALLIGLFIVGPVIAIAYGIILVLSA